MRMPSTSSFSSRQTIAKAHAIKQKLLDERARREAEARGKRHEFLEVLPSLALPKGWAVAVVMAGNEQSISDEICGAGGLAFCPHERRRVGSGMREREAARALFPRYVFVNSTGAALRQSKLSYLVDSEGKRLCVAGDLVIGLAEAERAGVFDRTLKRGHKRIVAGDSVRIVSGPLKGWLVDVVSVVPGKRLMVLMNMLGVASEVTLPFDKVELVS